MSANNFILQNISSKYTNEINYMKQIKEGLCLLPGFHSSQCIDRETYIKIQPKLVTEL